jgi:catechol-2,3-dioxygenase
MQITELHLLTNDLNATREFYQEKFGLSLLTVSKDAIAFQLPQSVLFFHAAVVKNPQYHIALSIPCNLAAASLEWLKDKAELIPVEEGQYLADFQSWNAESVYFFDNNRNIMEFIGRRDLHNASKESFGPRTILGISEIGLVTPDVAATCLQLQKTYGTGYFPRQRPGKHFAAAGDDEGLFIVVTEQRNWFPTEIPSHPYWLKITFRQQGKEFTLEAGGPNNF